jgi:hypothetical protein
MSNSVSETINMDNWEQNYHNLDVLNDENEQTEINYLFIHRGCELSSSQFPFHKEQNPAWTDIQRGWTQNVPTFN